MFYQTEIITTKPLALQPNNGSNCPMANGERNNDTIELMSPYGSIATLLNCSNK